MTETLSNVERVVDAAETFAALMSNNADMMSDTMASLTCTEADALVALVRVCGWEDAADMLAAAHADGDEEGDAHYPEVVTPGMASELVVDSHFRLAEGDDYRETFVTLDVGTSKHVVVVTADREGERFTLHLAPDSPVYLITYPLDAP